MTASVEIDWFGSGGQGGSRESTSDRGAKMLANLLRMPIEDFEQNHWLQKYCLQRFPRDTVDLPPAHPANMMPLADIKALLRRRKPRPARYLHDVDVTRYVNGRRMALSSGSEDIDHKAVWTAFTRDGYSIRIVHPQQWHQASFELCSCLQEYFGFPVGCSAYLTPAGSQGFPPHYDDVEVFVLQLEGSKRWRLYDRPDAESAPAADTTTEFTQEDLSDPIDELTLHPGDLLYLPRGVVHQALAQESGHSLHLTFSTYQRHTWRDLLADESLMLSRRAADALEALRAPHASPDTDGGGSEGVLRGMGLLRGLPRGIMRIHTAGKPLAAWDRYGAQLVPPACPFWLTKELQCEGTLGRAIDALALRYLQNSLPPPFRAAAAAADGDGDAKKKRETSRDARRAADFSRRKIAVSDSTKKLSRHMDQTEAEARKVFGGMAGVFGRAKSTKK